MVHDVCGKSTTLAADVAGGGLLVGSSGTLGVLHRVGGLVLDKLRCLAGLLLGGIGGVCGGLGHHLSLLADEAACLVLRRDGRLAISCYNLYAELHGMATMEYSSVRLNQILQYGQIFALTYSSTIKTFQRDSDLALWLLTAN
jgi:hypothetical protein